MTACLGGFQNVGVTPIAPISEAVTPDQGLVQTSRLYRVSKPDDPR